MKNRFTTEKPLRGGAVGTFLPLAAFVLIVALFSWGVNSIGETATQEQLRSAKNAVVRATVQCYALEGRYPPDINYLRENYGLSVDEDKYLIHYDVFAANLMPQIAVIPREGGGDWLL